jgi:plasmid stabilization system protein ParE
MAALKLSFAPRALAEVAAIVRWWREHRPSAPHSFEADLDAALATIATYPEIGPSARLRGHPSGRFYLLRRTGYVVFYLVDTARNEIVIVRVRHVRRRPLKRPRRNQ